MALYFCGITRQPRRHSDGFFPKNRIIVYPAEPDADGTCGRDCGEDCGAPVEYNHASRRPPTTFILLFLRQISPGYLSVRSTAQALVR